MKGAHNSTYFVGLTTFDNNTIFVADAGAGTLSRLTVSTGDYKIISSDKALQAPTGSFVAEGIHGIEYYNGDVYYSNTFGTTFGKIKIDPATLSTGPATSFAKPPSSSGPEGLAIGSDGTIYLALMQLNEIWKIAPDGSSGKSIGTVTSPTCVSFGRTDKDKNTLYIATSKGAVFALPAN